MGNKSSKCNDFIERNKYNECCICYVKNDKLYQLCETCIYKYCFFCIEKSILLYDYEGCIMCKKKINLSNEIFNNEKFLKIHEKLFNNEHILNKIFYFRRTNDHI